MPETILAELEKRGLPATPGLGERGTRVIAAPKRTIAPTGVAARGLVVLPARGGGRAGLSEPGGT
jgi:hypothetical protein